MYSAIKSWMYADSYLKPEEEILIREVQDGGLGLACIESKCLATLTVTFIQAAINPEYSRNNYLNALYEYFVCGVGPKKIKRPPYYSDLFFKNIKEAKESGRELISMSIKDWYHYYKRVRTHYYKEDTEEWLLKTSRVEFLHPELNHTNCYEKIRKSGLPSRLISPLLKLKLDLYLTEERRKNCNISNTSRCSRCARVDYVGHVLICPTNPYKKICDTVIELYKNSEINISLEGIVNSDYLGSTEDFYPLG